MPKDAFCIVGITMIDLYPKDSWNFVFGQASLSMGKDLTPKRPYRSLWLFTADTSTLNSNYFVSTCTADLLFKYLVNVQDKHHFNGENRGSPWCSVP